MGNRKIGTAVVTAIGGAAIEGINTKFAKEKAEIGHNIETSSKNYQSIKKQIDETSTKLDTVNKDYDKTMDYIESTQKMYMKQHLKLQEGKQQAKKFEDAEKRGDLTINLGEDKWETIKHGESEGMSKEVQERMTKQLQDIQTLMEVLMERNDMLGDIKESQEKEIEELNVKMKSEKRKLDLAHAVREALQIKEENIMNSVGGVLQRFPGIGGIMERRQNVIMKKEKERLEQEDKK